MLPGPGDFLELVLALSAGAVPVLTSYVPPNLADVSRHVGDGAQLAAAAVLVLVLPVSSAAHSAAHHGTLAHSLGRMADVGLGDLNFVEAPEGRQVVLHGTLEEQGCLPCELLQRLILMQLVRLLPPLELLAMDSVSEDGEDGRDSDEHERDVEEEQHHGAEEGRQVVDRHHLHVPHEGPREVDEGSVEGREALDLIPEAQRVGLGEANEDDGKHGDEGNKLSQGLPDCADEALHNGHISEVLHALHPEQHGIHGMEQLHQLRLLCQGAEIYKAFLGRELLLTYLERRGI
mmetsp:Transcript_54503/g.118018  ORF Transcript_54503/g.118018 Transcript_54503/m.118018 type:complete len:290 (+) Transcript_54503:474-1343(+)